MPRSVYATLLPADVYTFPRCCSSVHLTLNLCRSATGNPCVNGQHLLAYFRSCRAAELVGLPQAALLEPGRALQAEVEQAAVVVRRHACHDAWAFSFT